MQGVAVEVTVGLLSLPAIEPIPRMVLVADAGEASMPDIHVLKLVNGVDVEDTQGVKPASLLDVDTLASRRPPTGITTDPPRDDCTCGATAL